LRENILRHFLERRQPFPGYIPQHFRELMQPVRHCLSSNYHT